MNKGLQIQHAAGKVAAARGGTDGTALIEATAELVSLVRDDTRFAEALAKLGLRGTFEPITEPVPKGGAMRVLPDKPI